MEGKRERDGGEERGGGREGDKRKSERNLEFVS
jgi:hypothetical protein